MDSRSFFGVLYPSLSKNNRINVRGIDPKTSRPIRNHLCASIDEIVASAEELDRLGYNAYFECAILRADADNGRTENCLSYPFLYADVDDKEKSGGEIVKTFTKDELMTRIKAAPLPPSVIVDSGHGYHVYWLLDVPLYDKQAVQLLLKKLNASLGGDPQTTLLTQILRVPGTRNFKGDPPLPVAVVEENGRRYSFAELVKTLGISQEELQAKPSKAKAPPRESAVYQPTGISFDFATPPPPLNVTVESLPEVIRLIKQQNMLLGSSQPNYPMNTTFQCCFHEDRHPSANVYRGPDGLCYYKCFGCGKKYDIFSVYQHVRKVPFSVAVVELCRFFGINFRHSDWVVRQWEKYYVNANVVEDFEILGYASMYPWLYRLLKPRLNYLQAILFYGQARISSEKFSHDGENLFFFSYEYLAAKYNLSLATLVRNVNLFTLLGLVKKVPMTKIPPAVAEKAKRLSDEKKAALHMDPKQPVNFYIVPDLRDVFEEADRRARMLHENRFTVRNCMNKMFLIRAFGQDVADEVYPDERTITPVSTSIEGYLRRTLKRLIVERGYATKDLIVSKTVLPGRLKADRKRKERELERYFSTLLAESNLEYIRATNEIKDAFRLSGNIFVIVPKGLR